MVKKPMDLGTVKVRPHLSQFSALILSQMFVFAVNVCALLCHKSSCLFHFTFGSKKSFHVPLLLVV